LVHRVKLQGLVDSLLDMFLHLPESAYELRSDLIDLNDRLILTEPALHTTCATPESPDQKQKPQSDNSESERIDRLLRFYGGISGNRIKQADRDALRQMLDRPDSLIRAGIVRAVLYCRERVGSFAYCLKVMGELERAGLEPELTLRDLAEKLLTKVQAGQMSLPLETGELLGILQDIRK
jgi:hypothetical protein